MNTINANLGKTLCKLNTFIVILDLLFVIYCISRHQKAQARWFHYFSLTYWRHSNDDFYDMQTMGKPKNDSKMTQANQIQPCVNFSTPNANPKILGIQKSFAKSSRDTAYFHGLITCPIFLDQSVEVTFSGEKKVYMVYIGLHQIAPRCMISGYCSMIS